jgi:hypothetical protein
MNWHEAVLDAIKRLSRRYSVDTVSRHQLINEELPQIISETDTQGLTPSQTLSRVLQDLRDEGCIQFLGHGEYKILTKVKMKVPVDIESGDYSDNEIDRYIRDGRLRFEYIKTDSVEVQARRRKGQSRLRLLTLENYSSRCAVCDVNDINLLVTSHIVAWSENPESRGVLSNVLCLCRFHDALFEAGYWSLSDDLRIIINQKTQSKTIAFLLSEVMHFQKPCWECPSPEYLTIHRAKNKF